MDEGCHVDEAGGMVMREDQLEAVREALLIGYITVKLKRDIVREGIMPGFPDQIENDLDEIEAALTLVNDEISAINVANP